MLYKMSEWAINERWHCGCVDDLGNNSGYWLYPARILGMTPADYIEWVINNYNPIIWHNEDCSLVFFSWENQSDMRKFKNYINAAARKINYQI